MKKNNLFVLIAFFMLAQLSLFGQETNITWTKLIRTSDVDTTGGNITKIAGSGDWKRGNAVSLEQLEAGEDGYIQFTVKDDDVYKAFGFIQPNLPVELETIEYAFYAEGTRPHICVKEQENGTVVNRHTNILFEEADVIRLERRNSVIRCLKIHNSYQDTIFTFSNPSTTPLVAFVLIHAVNGSFQATKFSNGLSPFETEANETTVEEAPVTETQEAPATEVQEGEWGKVHRMTGEKYAFGSDSLKCPGNFKIYVENGILSKRVKVAVENSNNWADDVFAEGYQRNSLSKVAAYVKENKHLPNVPSAEEVVKNGIDLQQMDATLLRQVEEIWLHLIDTDKKVKQLEKENRQLRQQIVIQKTIIPKTPNNFLQLLFKKK